MGYSKMLTLFAAPRHFIGCSQDRCMNVRGINFAWHNTAHFITTRFIGLFLSYGRRCGRWAQMARGRRAYERPLVVAWRRWDGRRAWGVGRNNFATLSIIKLVSACRFESIYPVTTNMFNGGWICWTFFNSSSPKTCTENDLECVLLKTCIESYWAPHVSVVFLMWVHGSKCL